MAHIVCRKGRYYSLEESYREGKKVKKRRLVYFGTRRPDDPQARYEQMIATAERKAGEWDEFQRKEFGETGAERAERLREEAKFSQRGFLEETSAPPASSEPDQTDASPDAQPSEPSSEPDAEPSED